MDVMFTETETPAVLTFFETCSLYSEVKSTYLHLRQSLLRIRLLLASIRPSEEFNFKETDEGISVGNAIQQLMYDSM